MTNRAKNIPPYTDFFMSIDSPKTMCHELRIYFSAVVNAINVSFAISWHQDDKALSYRKTELNENALQSAIVLKLRLFPVVVCEFIINQMFYHKPNFVYETKLSTLIFFGRPKGF